MLLLRIDDIVSGTKKASGGEGAGVAAPTTGAQGVEGMEWTQWGAWLALQVLLICLLNCVMCQSQKDVKKKLLRTNI